MFLKGAVNMFLNSQYRDSDYATGSNQWNSIPGKRRSFSPRLHVQNQSAPPPPPASCLMDVKLTIRLHLVPRLRMSRAVPPLTTYVFMALCLIKHLPPTNNKR
jgi:hypothetical protein